MKKLKLAIFASGNGSNAEAIIQHLNNHSTIAVAAIYSNNSKAYVLERAKNYGISATTFTKDEFFHANFNDHLLKAGYDLIVLAGFMWLVPPAIVASFNKKIINIHPALLPKYGGKGMYGHFVHQAVVNNKEKESGITIHYVNDRYDEGDIIFQAKCAVHKTDTPDLLADRIHILEHRHYPSIIEKICTNKS